MCPRLLVAPQSLVLRGLRPQSSSQPGRRVVLCGRPCPDFPLLIKTLLIGFRSRLTVYTSRIRANRITLLLLPLPQGVRPEATRLDEVGTQGGSPRPLANHGLLLTAGPVERRANS